MEKIENSRIRYRRTEYYVKWKGYHDGHKQWIPWYNLDADELIEEFHRENPDAPRQH